MSLRVQRLAKLGRQPAMQEVERPIGRHIGQCSHGFKNFRERRQSAQIAHDQRRHDALAQTAQRPFQTVFIGDGLGIEESLHALCRHGRLLVVAQPVDHVRTRPKHLTKKTAVFERGLPGVGEGGGVHSGRFLRFRDGVAGRSGAKRLQWIPRWANHCHTILVTLFDIRQSFPRIESARTGRQACGRGILAPFCQRRRCARKGSE